MRARTTRVGGVRHLFMKRVVAFSRQSIGCFRPRQRKIAAWTHTSPIRTSCTARAGSRRASSGLRNAHPRFGCRFARFLDLEAFSGAKPRKSPKSLRKGETTPGSRSSTPKTTIMASKSPSPVGALLNGSMSCAHKREVIQHDAVEVARDMVPPGSLAGSKSLPDPWPKKRHPKRRLRSRVRELQRPPRPGGYFHVATDGRNSRASWPPSGPWTASRTHPGFAARPADRPRRSSRVAPPAGHGCGNTISASEPSSGRQPLSDPSRRTRYARRVSSPAAAAGAHVAAGLSASLAARSPRATCPRHTTSSRARNGERRPASSARP